MKYFITYGDENYEKSKQRLAKEAKAVKIFDKIFTYGKEDISMNVSNTQIFAQKKGGGYWIWKPDIVCKTLDIMDNGDILVYADSGCSVFKAKEWNYYFKNLEKYNLLVFMINTTVEQYTRMSIINFFSGIGNHWQKRLQIAATFFILKKTDATINLMNEWREIMITRPDLVRDVDDYKKESVRFKENRHDQSIFTALCYKYQKNYKIKVLYNHFDGGKDRLKKQAIIASRISDRDTRGGGNSVIKNLLFHLAVKPYRLIYQRYWTLLSK